MFYPRELVKFFGVKMVLWFHLFRESFPFREVSPFRKSWRDFPGGAVVKNPPASAGGHGFEPWSGKIPYAAEQLSPWATTTEPEL